MKRTERFGVLYEVIQNALDGRQANIWTALPGIIQSFDAAKQTCVVQPAIQGVFTDRDGVDRAFTMPQLLDVPVEFPQGGGYVLTFPVAEGDECMVILSSRCFDGWWLLGGVQPQMDRRMHDLSDAVAFVGIRSQPRKLAGVSVNSVQLRADGGEPFVEIKGTEVNIKATTVNVTSPQVNVVASAQVHVTTPTVLVTGDVSVTGKIEAVGDVIVHKGLVDQLSLDDLRDKYDIHTHGNVQNGPGNTSGPTPTL